MLDVQHEKLFADLGPNINCLLNVGAVADKVAKIVKPLAQKN
jgi:hypothetical protein